ncbi:MAG TPA: metal ABC transporter permease [Gammaproteobacteria bacterium]|nr:metal ABC transporter permease [Gammaproteobacteria bacterium]
MNTAGLDPGILGPAFLAGLLVLSTHVPLGRQVLRRGIIFIDLAIAQIAGVGVLLAHAMAWEDSPLTTQLTAFSAALLGALALYLCERRWPEILEAVIGTSFILAASAAILILANNPHGGEHLKDLLVGQVLWVDADRLAPVALLYALILCVWFGLGGVRRPGLFYTLFALAITASVQLVGVYLVFASLIIPALSVRRVGKYALPAAYLLGALGYAAGLVLSALLDLPSGAVIVWVLALIALTCSLLVARFTTPPGDTGEPPCRKPGQDDCDTPEAV